MRFLIKIAVTLVLIVTASTFARRHPTLGGLVAAMPLTTLITLLWIYSDHPNDNTIIVEFTRGVLWGIIPTILFFGVLLICFKKRLPLGASMSMAFAIWASAAALHQFILNE
jgi:uncharacterized membrane protein (GlpM family)